MEFMLSEMGYCVCICVCICGSPGNVTDVAMGDADDTVELTHDTCGGATAVALPVDGMRMFCGDDIMFLLLLLST